MKYLVTGKEMKLYDENTSTHFHVPELVLMEQAALGFVRELFSLEEREHRHWERALILCGGGNNGADGLAVARLLSQRCRRVAVLLCGEGAGHSTSASYRVQREICEAYDIPIAPEFPEDQEFDLIVDAVFGTGLSRGVEGALAGILERANAADAWRVALDISSGILADSGAVPGAAFLADDTITFSFGKLGQFLWPGNERSGAVHIVPIGITEESFLGTKPGVIALEQGDLALPGRRAHSNKGTYGRLLVIAGSVNMAGAAVLCALAAYRAGCGLVRVLTAEENRVIIQSALPEAVLSTYGSRIDEAQTAQELRGADAVVIGPGIGRDRRAQELLTAVLRCARTPLVLDADALNLLAENEKLIAALPERAILTPHLGEMARLTGKSVAFLQEHLCDAAAEFAHKYSAICVLKDFRTVTALPEGPCFLNLSGNPGMATAGSGDVLAGMIGSLLAQGMAAEQAAAQGVLWHGLAGDTAAERVGMRAMMATDIVDGMQRYSSAGGRV